MSTLNTFDVIIVGTGAGGATLGKALSEKGARVLWLEEGPHFPKESHRDLGSEAVSRLYRNRGVSLALGVPGFPLLSGKCVGGTTVINGATCFRLPERVLTNWKDDFGLTDLTLEELNRDFDTLEHELGVEDSKFENMSRINTLLHEILARHGIKGKPLKRNAPGCTGCGMCCYGCTGGAKKSMDVSMIPAGLGLGAELVSDFKVDRILFSGKKAIGVSGKTGQYFANQIVIAGGTLFTPSILSRSGIRNAHLGRHLTVHPATKLYAEFNEDINGWEGTPQAYYVDTLEKEGILLEGIFMPPDVAAPMLPLGAKLLHKFMGKFRKMACFGIMIEDSSAGRVVDLPILGPTAFYSLTSKDVAKIKRASVFLADAFFKGGAKRVMPMIRNPKGEPIEFQNEDDLKKFNNHHVKPGHIELAAFHPLGTARMGTSPETGVTDSYGRVFGRENLYVCDGSLMPSSLGVNPQLTIMGMAMRVARGILKTHAIPHRS